MKNILAGILGLILGVFTIGIVQWFGNLQFPADVPFPEEPEEWEFYMERVPFMAKCFVILAYVAGGFVAGIVTTFVQGRTLYRPTLVATAVMQLFAWLNMMSLPHPLWMWLLGSVAIVPMGWVAYRLIRRTPTSV
jgi:hypothetical protein